ncbi:MAG: beta-glucosidase BglX [Armatimonadota bacterium]
MSHEAKVRELLAQMTLAEKIGQMWQLDGGLEGHKLLVRAGKAGSILNLNKADEPQQARKVNEFQRIAVEETRLGIPLIIGRDVIHGFRTVFPIPLGQAASFDMALVEEGARIAAREAASQGINWTFAPMVDIARDPRWGRIAEGGGEDPLLTSRLGAAMVRGFQGALSSRESIAACAKHYVGYGAAEAGRDYNTTWIPEGLLRDVYLPSFRACVDAGVCTLMSAFNDLNGIPASGNEFTLRRILKGEWGFDGFVVSDWASIEEMISHGFCAGKAEAAHAGITAGVDMEMVTDCYIENAERLVADGKLDMALIDDAVARILRIKLRLGLFDHPYVDEDGPSVLLAPDHREAARKIARESCVLLKNAGMLPLAGNRLAVIGPLADNGAEQLGCWTIDGRGEDCVTPLAALREAFSDELRYAAGLPDARSLDTSGFAEAVEAAKASDAVVLFLGEDSGLSGEAHSRAFLDLPGAQLALLDAVRAAGTPVAVVILTGRPLLLEEVVKRAQAVLVAWHPGTMGGPAIADLLLGAESPSGKLPVTFPLVVGQVPVYYAHRNGGRPPAEDRHEAPTGTPLNPETFTSTYLDVDHRPLFPFGFGLSYTTFEYSELKLSSTAIRENETLEVAVSVTNTGAREGTEVVQLYVRDPVASVTRPVRELKEFQRVPLAPGATKRVTFRLSPSQLAFHGRDMQLVVEPGEFQVFVGGSSEAKLEAAFTLLEG